jgi:hypothetical protein
VAPTGDGGPWGAIPLPGSLVAHGPDRGHVLRHLGGQIRRRRATLTSHSAGCVWVIAASIASVSPSRSTRASRLRIVEKRLCVRPFGPWVHQHMAQLAHSKWLLETGECTPDFIGQIGEAGHDDHGRIGKDLLHRYASCSPVISGIM